MIKKEYVNYLIKKYGNTIQDIICIEELSELQKEITKSLRGKENKEHLIEEIADCLLTIQVIIQSHNIDIKEIDKVQEDKLRRVGIIC